MITKGAAITQTGCSMLPISLEEQTALSCREPNVANCFAHAAQIVNSIPAPVLETTGDGIIQSFNLAAQEVFGTDLCGELVSEFLPELRSSVLAAVVPGSPFRFEHCADGHVFLFEVTRTDTSNWLHVFGTEMIQHGLTEEKPRESKEQYRALIEGTLNLIFSFTPDGTLTYVGPQVSQYGYTPEEVVGRNIWEFVHPEDVQRVSEELQQTITSGVDRPSEYRLIGKDGHAHWVESVSRVVQVDGEIVRLTGVIRDITERKQAELIRTKSLERQERLNQLQQVLLAPGELTQKLKMITGGVVDIFGADFCRIWCIGPGDLCDLGCIHAANSDGMHVCHERDKCLRLMASSGRYTHTDGAVHRRVPFGAYKIGLVASGQEHKFLTNDVTRDPRVHNHGWARELGLVSFAGYQLRPPDGETLGVLALFSTHAVTPEENAQLDALSSTTAQVIRAAQIEESLRESEERLRTISMAAHDAIIMMDDKGNVSFWNDASTRMFGLSREEAIGRNLHALVAPERYNDAHQKAFGHFQATGEGAALGRVVELVGKRKDGSEFPVELSVSPIQVGQCWHAVGIVRDITERTAAEARRRELERRLANAGRLESVGSLAAGIAHEINTPIQFVGDNTRYMSDAFGAILTLINKRETIWRRALEKGNLSALADEWQQSAQKADLEYNVEEIPRAISQTLEGVQRVTGIVRAMKNFAHQDQKERTVSDINEMLESTLTVARNELKYVANVVTDFDSTLPQLECHRNELNQVFLNLLINSAHAIADVVGDGSGGKGTITVTTQHVGDEIVVSIADTGTGIPENIRDRVFDPFFTTKDVGKGTGQGLAIAHSVVVDKHRGQLRFDSSLGRGTTFYVHLPLAAARETERA